MITDIIRDDARQVADSLGRLLEPMAGGTVLVTGAAGFLGGFFMDVLDAFNRRHPGHEARVVALDNYLVGPPARLAHLEGRPWLRRIAADVARPLSELPAADWIIHCASIGSPSLYRANPLATIAANVQGTWSLLELARGGAHGMLSFSSSEVYGDPLVVPTPEDYRGNVSFTGPRACYDESKRLGETLCATYFRLHRVPVKVIRPFNVYGPGQRLDDGRIIPDLVRAALAGGPLVLYSDGAATRSFCYVSDFVEACLTLLMMPEADGEAFNVGNVEEVTIAEVAHTMAELAAEPPLEVRFETAAEGAYLVDNPQRRCPDLDKLHRLTGFAARIPLRTGLSRTLASYREERAAPPLRAAGE
ncbi:NAD-dependent epimerase/dehydratase family protein [Magnetospirillum sp. UT-4]|uniref:NAD-dependent epimerase/dehydratase family protein n=1 Tax=Magnetospirillum sp. UT-4 TaxID=2681467 RepID=UPI001380C9AD|nr:NAD-dependent epimerase/dehydratase family protein [Magnetospirillum sp. UT-4]CAA7625516.1 Nucleoside-diphosphate-sugar epimerase [Magnetospirillum sp. UT-4]